MIVPDHGLICGDDHHIQPIDLVKFVGLRIRRASHTPELFVEAEEILEGGGGQGLGLLLDLHPFLRFHGLVEPLGPAPPRHGPPGVLVNDDDLPLLDDVVHVPAINKARPERCVHVMQEAQVLGGVEAVLRRQEAGGLHGLLELFVPFFEELDLTILLVDGEVPGLLRFRLLPSPGRPRRERPHELINLAIKRRGIFCGPGNNQGGASLVDEDRVHLIDNSEVAIPLDLVLRGESHVVPEVIKAKLVVRAVGDVGEVGRALLRAILPGSHHPHGEPERLVHRRHPGGVPLGQVVVNGDHVHAAPRKRIQIDRQGSNEGFPLPGAHLGNAPLVEGHAPHELHVKMAKAEGSAGRLSGGGKGLGENRV